MEGVTGVDRSDSVKGDQTPADLRVELGERDLARHLALFFQSTTVQLQSVAAYLDYGLKNGYRCLYLTDTNSPTQIKDALRAINIDVDGHIQAGDLVVSEASTVYLDPGFDPERMIAILNEECQDSISEGYEGLWMAGENTWCFHTEMSYDPILDFEADFDATCPELPVIALCQYDLNKFSEESAAKSLWTHKQILYRYTICENPFYISPDEYRKIDDPSLNAKLMLEQAYNLTNASRKVEKREQRLSVLSRVLRHNLRNDLNLVRGTLQNLRELHEFDGHAENRLDLAISKINDIIEMAEEARYIQQTVEDTTTERVRLGAIIKRAVNEIATKYPDAEMNVSGEQNVTILADPNLDKAISEAFKNAIIHQESDSPTVSVNISTPSSETARIDIRNPGSIPEWERRTFEQGYETQLGHASGLGPQLCTFKYTLV